MSKKNVILEEIEMPSKSFYLRYAIKGFAIAMLILTLYGTFYIGGISACQAGNGEAYKDGLSVVCYNTDEYKSYTYEYDDSGVVHYDINRTDLLV